MVITFHGVNLCGFVGLSYPRKSTKFYIYMHYIKARVNNTPYYLLYFTS